VQFDRTTIVVRERSVLDTLDLSLHVLREYALPLAAAMLLGALPLLAVDYLLLGWMASEAGEDAWLPWRFVYHLSLQIYLQAPLASVFATAYLGQAVFLAEPRFGDVVRDAWRMLPRIAWCHLLVRGVLLGWLLVLVLERDGEVHGFVEALLLPVLAVYVSGLRAFRPFINEIVLLERNPLTSQNERIMTVGRRSRMLHGSRGGEWLIRWLLASVLGVLLILAAYGTFYFHAAAPRQDWTQGPLLTHVLLPLAMGITTCYLTVFRFLTYLDARIRQEGWEVELQLRAEAARLTRRPI